MAVSDLHLQLGDIIEIIAPTDDNLHEKQYLITYIDETEIQLLNEVEPTTLYINDDHSLRNESITAIHILDRASVLGYARQNKLLPESWVNIYFSGEVPLVVTGQITNLEEDQIEITSIDKSLQPIYIDFAYKGIPKDIPIEKIELRDTPSEIIDKDGEELDDLEDDRNIDKKEFEDDINEVITSSIEDMEEQIKDKIFEADQLQFGEDLDEISQIIDIPDEKKKFSIDKQTNDILDDLLSNIPNNQRTMAVLNNIHTLIERYVQLRNIYSIFDKYNNIQGYTKNGNMHKPLTKTLSDLSHKLYWILPVAKNKKHLYDIEAFTDADGIDVEHLELSDVRTQESDFINSYLNNSIAGENNYYALVKGLTNFYTPFSEPSFKNLLLTTRNVKTNMHAVIDNLDNFNSSIFKNKDISQKRFYLQNYVLGEQTIQMNKVRGGDTALTYHKITDNDKISIKSFLTLPIQTLHFSRINLPTTNILTRANLNENFLSYWKLLNDHTDVSTKIIEALEAPDDTSPSYLKKSTEYILDETIEEDDKYNKFLNRIIPTTQNLFTMIKNKIPNNLSVHGILQYLEPFMIYQHDLTDDQHTDFMAFITEKIEEFKTNFIKRRDAITRKLNKYKSEAQEPPYLLTLLPEKEQDQLLTQYNIDRSAITTNYSLLKHMTTQDNALFYNTLLAKSSFSLMVPYATAQVQKLEELVLPTEQKIEPSPSANTSPSGDACSTYVLSKKYVAIDEMEEDNNKEIYFDKQYDKTYYDLLDDYKKYLTGQALTEPEKIAIIAEKLQENVGFTNTEALIEATALIQKKRKVNEGDYCVVVLNDEEDTKYLYYKRESQIWQRDTSITDDVFGDKSKLFCNLSANCLELKQSCDTLENSEKQIKNKNLMKIVKEFDTNMQEGLDEIKRKIDNLIILYADHLPKVRNIKNQQQYKYNTIRFNLGTSIEDVTIEQSPHTKIRDTILGLTDFTKKQTLILQFMNKYTRPASEHEDSWWLYCIDSNIKLLPTFIVELASAFVEGTDYMKTIYQICKKQGEYSDDGGAWVDKYSGYYITSIALDTDEGYEESGFKQVSRAIIEKSTGEMLMQGTTTTSGPDKYKNPTTKKIYNVILTMSEYMYVDVEQHIPYIIQETLQKLKTNLPSKEELEAVKKGAYKKQYNTLLIVFAICYFLISIQTNIPSLKINKGFPGCKRSITGYPLGGEEDLSAIHYIACIIKKISKKSIEPWSTFAKQKLENINVLIKKILDDIVLKDKSTLDKLDAKTKYLLHATDELIPLEHDIKNWHTFLPPLMPLQLKTTENISKIFEQELASNLKNGTKEQYTKMLVLFSKPLYLSLHIQVLINKTIKNTDALMTNSSGEPFLENSCCDDGTQHSLNYFMEKEPEIRTLNEKVRNLNNIQQDITLLTKAKILFYTHNTKPIYPPLSTSVSEETIYKAFIIYCRFTTAIPIDDDLKSLCLEKPTGFEKLETLQDKIHALKRVGKQYSFEQFKSLMSTINNRNIVDAPLRNIVVNNIQILRSMLEAESSLHETEIGAFPIEFIDKFIMFIDLLATDSTKVKYTQTAVYDDFVNYLVHENESMKSTIITFIKRNVKKYNKDVDECLHNMLSFHNMETTRFISGEDETTIKQIDFIKSVIRLLCDVFPNIIRHQINPCASNCKIPKHWKLSDFHNKDMVNILNKFYLDFVKHFDDDSVHQIITDTLSLNKIICNIACHTIYLTNTNNNGALLFNKNICNMLHEYYLQRIFMNIIHKTENTINVNMKTPAERDELDELEEALSDDDVVAQQLLMGKKENTKEKIAELFSTYCSVIVNKKKGINYNYERLMERVNRAKEKEKVGITDYLKAMTDEEREIENLFKNQKLERWSKGLQKGFRTYEGKTYDQERNAMEKQALLEKKLGENNLVTEMNKDVFMMEMLESEAASAEIEAEEYSMAHLPDDDDYGEHDGDEGY